MNAPDRYTLRCRSCGTRNRIPADRAGQTAKCGRCGSPVETAILLDTKPVTVSDRTFDTEVLQSPLPVLLDCWAPWCGPCKTMGPVMAELAGQWRGRVRVAKLNVDQNPNVASRFQVMSVPTFLVFDRGQLLETIPGAVPKAALVQKMSRFL